MFQYDAANAVSELELIKDSKASRVKLTRSFALL